MVISKHQAHWKSGGSLGMQSEETWDRDAPSAAMLFVTAGWDSRRKLWTR